MINTNYQNYQLNKRFSAPVTKLPANLTAISFVGRLLKPLIKEEDVVNIFKNEIVPIPRGSGNCEEISKYLAEQLKGAGFEVIRQEKGAGKGNIIASRNIKGDTKNAVMLQAHMDMVYVTKNDKKEQPVVPIINGKYLMAKNTSLGADDGIGVALALAVARLKAPEIASIPMQIIFTVDEETGLHGVKDIPVDAIKGNYLINLDNGNPSKIVVGCAGLADFEEKASVPMARLKSISDTNHSKIVVEISNAKGGHSALDINKGRINPIISILETVAKYKDDIKITSIKGGEKINSIPTSARLELLVPENRAEEIKKEISDDLNSLKGQYHKQEAGLIARVLQGKASQDQEVLTPDFQEKLFDTFTENIKNGTLKQVESSPKPVTSQSVGVLNIENGQIEIQMRLRSNEEESYNKELTITEKSLSDLLGKEIKPSNSVPVWERKTNPFTELAVNAYEDIYDKKPYLTDTHGTVEGAFFDRYVDGQVGIGPEVKSMHTPDERLSIPSVGPLCDFVEVILKKFKDKFVA